MPNEKPSESPSGHPDSVVAAERDGGSGGRGHRTDMQRKIRKCRNRQTDSHRNLGVAGAFLGGQERPLPVGKAVRDTLDPSINLKGQP